MDCSKFQDLISESLSGELESRARAECAAHRLCCRACRQVYSDVRATLGALKGLAAEPMPAPVALEQRILAATTAGVMLNCQEFDRLLERYFDGVILAPTFQTFQAHFGHCSKCRRLLGSIEDAIELCHEAKTEVEIPPQLCDRIVAATSGRHPWRASLDRLLYLPLALTRSVRSLWTPQWAAAVMISLSTCLLVTLRFGSVSGLASQAGAQAERLVTEGHSAINQTGASALIGFERVSDEVSNFWLDTRGRKTTSRIPPAATPAATTPSSQSSQSSQSGSVGEKAPEQRPTTSRVKNQ